MTFLALTEKEVVAVDQSLWVDMQGKCSEHFCCELDKEIVDIMIDELFERETESLRVSNPSDWSEKKIVPVWNKVFYRLKQIIHDYEKQQPIYSLS